MKLGIIDQLFYDNYKTRLREEGLDTFGGFETDKPIDIICILDEYFEQKDD